jgi:hypothetical protein
MRQRKWVAAMVQSRSEVLEAADEIMRVVRLNWLQQKQPTKTARVNVDLRRCLFSEI